MYIFLGKKVNILYLKKKALSKDIKRNIKNITINRIIYYYI